MEVEANLAKWKNKSGVEIDGIKRKDVGKTVTTAIKHCDTL